MKEQVMMRFVVAGCRYIGKRGIHGWLVTLVAGVCLLSAARAQEPPPPPTDQEPATATAGAAPLIIPPASTQAATLLRQVPQGPGDLPARVELAEARLTVLAPTTQPAESPEAPDAALRADALALYDAWQNYLGRVQRAAGLYTAIEELGSPAQVELLSTELVQIEAQALELAAALPIEELRAVTAADVEALRQRVQGIETARGILADEQARRAAQLAGGFAQRRAQLEAELRVLRQEHEAAVQQPEAEAAVTTAPATESLGERRLRVLIGALELALHNIALDERHTELLQRRDERRLTVQRELLTAAQARLAQLTEELGRSQLERLELERQATTRPFERALLDTEVFVERVLQRYFTGPERVQTLQRYAADTRADRLIERINTARAAWERIVDTLDYRSSEETRTLYLRSEADQIDITRRAAELRRAQVELLTLQQNMQTARDRALLRFVELAAAVEGEASGTDAAERTRLDAQLAELRARFAETMSAAMTPAGPVLDRLITALERADEHLSYLETVNLSLFWRRIGSRDAGVLRTDWRRAGTELRAVVAAFGPPAAVLAAAEADLDATLFGGNDDEGRARTLLAALAAPLRVPGSAVWTWGPALLALSVVCGIVLTVLARRRGVVLARHIETDYLRPRPTDGESAPPPASGLSDRINLLGWNMLGDLAIVVLVTGALLVLVWQAYPEGRARLVVATLLGLAAAAPLAIRLVHHLFEDNSPAHRPLPCSDRVAQHYRWWLGTIIFYSACVLAVPLALDVGGFALTLRNASYEVFKTGLLVLLLLFLLPKQRVLGVFDAWQGQWVAAFAVLLYPVVTLVVVALLALQVVGFGALATYIGFGILVTGLLLIVALTVSEYVVDLLDHYAEREPRTRVNTAAPLAHSTGPERDGEPEDPVLAESRSRYVLALLRAAVRLALLATFLVGFLWIWNIRLPREWLDLHMLGTGALVLVAALVLDRLAYAALFALHRGGRLPESIVNLLRRWLRGVLTVLAALSFIALSGWRIDSIWTLLTTVVAMIAVAFVAVWSILSNLLATIVILIWRPFNIGEQVEILPEGLQGRVVDINFMYTVLQGEGGTRMSVPNNLFAQKFIRRKTLRGVPVRTLAEQIESNAALGEDAAAPPAR